MDLFEWLFEKFGLTILNFLPLSPFQPYIQYVSNLPYLGELNWFFPIGQALTVMGAWLTVITTYYLYSVILRWLRMIS